MSIAVDNPLGRHVEKKVNKRMDLGIECLGVPMPQARSRSLRSNRPAAAPGNAANRRTTDNLLGSVTQRVPDAQATGNHRSAMEVVRILESWCHLVEIMQRVIE